jgi:hypothetical protein
MVFSDIVSGGFVGAARSRQPLLADDNDLRADTIRPYGKTGHDSLMYNGFCILQSLSVTA